MKIKLLYLLNCNQNFNFFFVCCCDLVRDRRRIFSLSSRCARNSLYSNSLYRRWCKSTCGNLDAPLSLACFPFATAVIPSPSAAPLSRRLFRRRVATGEGTADVVPLQTHASRLSVPSSLIRIASDLFSSPRSHRRRSIQSPPSLFFLSSTHSPTPTQWPAGHPTPPSRRGDPARPRARLTAITLVHAPSVCRQPAYQSCRSAHVTKFLLLLLSLSLLALILGRWCVHSRFDYIYVARFSFSTPPPNYVPFTHLELSRSRRRNRHCRRRTHPRSRMKFATIRGRITRNASIKW